MTQKEEVPPAIAEATRRRAADANGALSQLLAIMAALRDPDHGCPWDREQTFATIAPYTIEEAFEVADAIERGDMDDLKDELGDLLLQVVYHARMAEEQGSFAFAGVAKAINEKMIRRHPHVFGEKGSGGDGGAPARWEEIKKSEREAKAGQTGGSAEPSLFDGIPAGLPALLKSAKLQKRAASIGFEWPSIEGRLLKLEEELAEFRAEIDAPTDEEGHRRRVEEFGDVMFVLVNIAMHLGIDSEAALRAANQKFVRRLSAMEDAARSMGRQLKGMSLEEMEELWQQAKSGLAADAIASEAKQSKARD